MAKGKKPKAKAPTPPAGGKVPLGKRPPTAGGKPKPQEKMC